MNLVSQGDLELLKIGLAEMGTRDTAIIHFTKELQWCFQSGKNITDPMYPATY